MTMRRVYQVGGRLSAVHHLFSEKEELGGTKDRDVRNLYRNLDRALANVAVTSDGPDTPPSEELKASDGYFLASIMLGILMRGPVSLLSTDAESEILARDSRILAVQPTSPQEANGVAFVNPDHRIVGTPDELMTLRRTMFAALCKSADGATTSWASAEDSQAEARFRDKSLTALLGPLARFVEHQRPMASMMDTNRSGLRNYRDSRVDFALELGEKWKIVFEVDGPQHADRTHQEDDRRRDAALTQAGWTVLRLPVGTGRHGFDEEELTKIESWLGGESPIKTIRALAQNAGPVSEKLLVTVPHAVARTQLCILLAMLDGTFSLDADEWSIVVFEREVAAAQTAVVDLRRHMLALAQLYGIGSIPLIVLRSIGDGHGDGSEASFDGIESFGGSWNVELDTRQRFDVAIDLAVHARGRDHFAQPAVLTARRSFTVRTAYHAEAEPSITWPTQRNVCLPLDEALESYCHFLRLIFRKTDFRELQPEVIHRAMQRKDVVALMPTGSGKSITFQLPTFLSPGHSIVISPIRSLMDDQVDNLSRVGISRGTAIHSGLEEDVRRVALDRIVHGNARLIYLSPERFHIPTFLNAFASSDVSRNVSRVAFDEAHCVSEWGHDFRPAYLRIAEMIRKECHGAPFMALTGTASEIVLTDTMRELSVTEEDDSVVSASSFKRSELAFYPINVAGKKSGKLREAMDLIRARVDPAGTMNLPANERVGGLAFCPFVNEQDGVVGVRTALIDAFGLTSSEVRIFSGAKPKTYDGGRKEWEGEKARTQSDFKENKYPIIACTKAFGMGIDKPNIRYTIHWGIPGSIEALAQEAGRAGRGKDPSACVILYNRESAAIDDGFLAPSISHQEARSRHEKLGWAQQDAGRIMFLHRRSYPGEDDDAEPMLAMLSEIQQAQQRQMLLGDTYPVTIRRPSIGDDDDAATAIDKAVYRLSILGVIADYTVQYGGRSAFQLDTHPVAAPVMRKAFVDYVGRYRTDREVEEDELRKRVNRSIEERAGEYLQRFSPPLTPEAVIRAFCAFVYHRIEAQRREALRNIVRIFDEAEGRSDHISTEIENYLSRSNYSGQVRELRSDLDPAAPNAWWELADDAFANGLEGRLAGAVTRALESEPDRVGYRVIAATMRLTHESPDYRSIVGQLVEAVGNTPGANKLDRREREHTLASRIMERIAARHPDRSDEVIRAIVARGDSDVLIRAAFPHAIDPDLKKLCAMPWVRKFAALSQQHTHSMLESAR